MITEKRRLWQDYEKDIATDSFFYVRSCIRQNFFPGSERAFLRIMREVFGRDVFEDPRHSTCSGIGYHGDIVPIETVQTIVARHFSLMKECGYENYVASCVTSFGIYTELMDMWEHFPELKEDTARYLKEATGRDFVLPKNLVHTSDVIYKLRQEIAERGKYRLVDVKTGAPLRVVDHVGCHYGKMFPGASVGGSEFPQVLAAMVRAWGGEVVDYPERRHCCGFGFRQYLVEANRGFSIANSYKKFASMEPYEPDFIIANCPGCAMFMDRWQYAIAEMEGRTFGKEGRSIPVLTYEEVAALILGFDPWETGLQMHQIPCEPLLDKMGIEYDVEKKYEI